MKRTVVLLLTMLLIVPAFSQPGRQPDASEILVKLNKLNFLGSVLYVAAHPDDENTRLIAYLENDQYARVAYLSLTRGDGGQNLIGPEIREALGVIRTQELLAARRIDGGDQYFSRANDFGYSKNADETLQIWDRDKVLADVVRIYRKFRPDVIITRFPPDERAGHGHHTSSAIMAQDAFDISGQKNAYAEQLKGMQPWQPVRLYTNTGRWWNPNMTGDEPGVVTLNVGAYNPLLGESMTEIAARSRSQHKSQGFGSTGERGESLEFLEFVKGEEAEKDIFEGIDTSWGRVSGGRKIGEKISGLLEQFDPAQPSAVLPDLLEVRAMIARLDDPFWRATKLKETDALIRDVLGLYLEARAGDWRLYPGQTMKVELEAINRSPVPVVLKEVRVDGQVLTPETTLENNIGWERETTMQVPDDISYTQPYWLREHGTLGMYQVEDPDLIGAPENLPALRATVSLDVLGTPLEYQVPVIHRWTDPVKGEQQRPLVIAPPVVVSIPTPVFLFPSGKTRQVEVRVASFLENEPVTVSLQTDEGWQISPEQHTLNDLSPGDERSVSFEITPPADEKTSVLKATATIGGRQYDRSQMTIAYDHFPAQTILPEATARLVNIPIRRYGDLVGYIPGAGDAIPETLRELGYEVRELGEGDISPATLSELDAVILGVRALNVNENIAGYMEDLLEYVHNGGTLIVQYNTSYRLKTEEFAPYPLTLSRLRVADENAPVTVLAPGHPVVNEPNIILPQDFDNWVQERGLYFPEEWDDAYTPILSSHDPGEPARKGGLLVAKYGEGHYIYTGYSWFRELPAGVTGAIKLFTNLVSLGNGDEATGQHD